MVNDEREIRFLFLSSFTMHHSSLIPHDPGAPPQRPHIGSCDAEAFAPSEPTANTLSARAVLVDPHIGHLTP